MTEPQITETAFQVGRGHHRRNATLITIGGWPTGYRFVAFGDRVFNPCCRCDDASGTCGAYMHVMAGLCAKCNGVGLGTEIKGGRDSLPNVVARRMASRERSRIAREAKLAERAVEFAARRAEEEAEAARVEAERQAKLDAQRYAGPEFSTVAVTGTVTAAVAREGRFGYSRLLIVDSGDGVTVKTFSNAKAAWAVEQGQRVTVTGMVKAHEIREDVKQTVIARPTIAATEE